MVDLGMGGIIRGMWMGWKKVFLAYPYVCKSVGLMARSHALAWECMRGCRGKGVWVTTLERGNQSPTGVEF